MKSTFLAMVAFFALALSAAAQQALSGRVVDPSGALVRNAVVTVRAGAEPRSPVAVVHADARGAFAVDQLAVGEYELSAEAEGFQPTKIVATLRAGEHGKTLTIRLNVAAVEEQVQVNADETAMRGSGPGGGITLSGRALDNLPTDPAALLQQLQQLSGGDLPQLFVDGFSGGALPPKNTIREIRINENTYSAKNDVSPSFGQIEVFTKPGSGSWHGSFFALGNDSAFNTSNPYTPNQPPYYNWRSSGDISGPLNRRASFDAELFRTSMQTSSIANGIVLDPSLAPITVFAAVQSPDVTTGISPRLDLAAGKNSTIIARYSATHETHINNGIVQLSLPTQAYNSNLTTQLMQLSNSQTIGASILNDTRFQYTRIRTTQAPASTDQTVSVQGAFTGGGNTLQRTDTHQDVYELQNYLTAQAGRHFLNLGARLRVHRDASFALSNFNGTFVYSSIASYQRTQRDALLGYSAAQIAADGGGATQFSLTAGSPRAAASVADAGAFAQDDWKVTPGVTLLAGLRYEAQSAVSEHHDFAPRAGLYWDLGAPLRHTSARTMAVDQVRRGSLLQPPRRRLGAPSHAAEREYRAAIHRQQPGLPHRTGKPCHTRRVEYCRAYHVPHQPAVPLALPAQCSDRVRPFARQARPGVGQLLLHPRRSPAASAQHQCSASRNVCAWQSRQRGASARHLRQPRSI